MRKLLVIITLFIALGNAYAQSDATSDATWEETTNFILKYADTYLLIGMMRGIDGLPEPLYDFKFVNKKLLFNYDDWDFSIDLSKLKNVEYNKHDEMEIIVRLTGSYVDIDYHNPKDEIQHHSSMRFGILDSEMRKRMYKAFSHLVELAIEQRKKEKKASGDKF